MDNKNQFILKGETQRRLIYSRLTQLTILRRQLRNLTTV